MNINRSDYFLCHSKHIKEINISYKNTKSLLVCTKYLMGTSKFSVHEIAPLVIGNPHFYNRASAVKAALNWFHWIVDITLFLLLFRFVLPFNVLTTRLQQSNQKQWKSKQKDEFFDVAHKLTTIGIYFNLLLNIY